MNPRQHGIRLVADFLIREAHDADAKPFENFSPPGVVIGEPFVLFSVELHDKFCGVAIEVDDEAIEWSLPPEFRAVKARTAQALPEKV